MKFFRKTKTLKIITTVLCGLLVLVVFSSFTYAQAQSAPPQPQSSGFVGKVVSWAVGGAGGTALYIINLVLWLLQTILAFILSVDAYLLNEAFKANVTTSPAAWSVVRQGWSISRDIVNSLFILIVLWIAFTIIFGQEQYGGKKLLARVVVMAIIINFSLVMVSAVFGFSNAFANIFAKQMPEDVSGFIVNAIKVQTVIGGGGEAEAQGQKVSFQQLAYEEKIKTAFNPQEDRWGVKDTLLASVGITPVTAEGEAPSGAGEPQIVKPAEGSTGLINESFKDTVTKDQPSWFASQVNDTVKFIAGILFLILTIAAVLVGAVALWMRILFMIFLSIVAPLALLAKVTPIGKVQGYFNQWTSMLFNWAFFAPGFYFLFYLSLYMLQTFDKLSVGSPSQTFAYLDFNKIIQLLLALGLMVMSVKFAKKTGGALTDAAMGAASKVGGLALGAATGGAGLAVGAAARAAAPQIQGALAAVSRVPVLGKLAAPATRRAAAYVEEQQQTVLKKKEQVKPETDDMLIAGIKAPGLAVGKIGRLLALLEREGGSAKAKAAGIDFDDMAEMSRKFGPKVVATILNAKTDTTPTKDFAGKTEDFIISQALNKQASAFDRIAATLEMLKKDGGAAKLGAKGADMKELLKIAEQFGDKAVSAIVKTRPDIASPILGPQFAVEKLMEKMRSSPDDAGRIDFMGMINDLKKQGMAPDTIAAEVRRLTQQIMTHGTPEMLQKVLANTSNQSKEVRQTFNVALSGNLGDQTWWDDLKKQDEDQYKRFVRFFLTGAGKNAGLARPAHMVQAAQAMGLYKGQGRTRPPGGRGGGGGTTP